MEYIGEGPSIKDTLLVGLALATIGIVLMGLADVSRPNRTKIHNNELDNKINTACEYENEQHKIGQIEIEYHGNKYLIDCI